MFIFYDLETSSADLLGQIMTYAFVVTDFAYQIKEELTGKIRLNSTQLPDPDAILVNRIDLTQHQAEGTSEMENAQAIFHFLGKWVKRSPYCILVGFNSNQFDLQFLRNLLIRYGHNPYFKGALQNLDVLHFAKNLALAYPDTFAWTQTEGEKGPYWGFKLEMLTKAFGIATGPQSHDAKEDVLLTIQLAQKLETQFREKLQSFRPLVIPDAVKGHPHQLGVEPSLHYPKNGEPLQKIIYKPWKLIVAKPKEILAIDLDKYEPVQDPLLALRYINPNKQFFRLNRIMPEQEAPLEAKIRRIESDPFFQTMTMERYFTLTAKNWDIEYQIHQLGFDRIDTLKEKITALKANPDIYVQLIHALMGHSQEPKDRFLIQLFNRFYLNNHPNPPLVHFHKYLIPRYIDGSLYRNPEEFQSLKVRMDRINEVLQNGSAEDQRLMQATKVYYDAFLKRFELSV